MARRIRSSLSFILILIALSLLASACATLQVGIEPTPIQVIVSSTAAATATATLEVPPQDLCRAYLDLLVSSGGREEEAVVTCYRCGSATIDSTGQTPSRSPTLAIEQGTSVRFRLSTEQQPAEIDVRLYPGAGVYASFMRWPEELPTAVEPVEGFQPEAGNRFEYLPTALPGTYSLVVKVTWEDRVEVFYAISVAVLGQTPTPSSTVSSEVVPTATPAPQPTLTPTSETSVVRVAFVREGNVWLWSEGEEARALTSGGGVTSLEISDDGEVVAFTREIELWAVNSDGSDERRLVTIGDIAAMVAPGDPGVRIYRVEWVPGTHVVAFNTRLQLEVGLVLNDDLRLVDADTGEQKVLLPRGEGGEFHYSPDGRQIALVRSGTITLVDADGGNRREVLTYTPPVTYSEFLYYARPVWAADSSSLRVVIPPVDPFAQPPQLASVWHLHTDGRMARLIGSIDDRSSGWVAFSPDLSHVAYLEQVEGARPGSNEGGLLVTNLDDGETVTVAEQAQDVYGWSPDGRHVAYMTTLQAPQAQIVRPGSDPVPVYEDLEVAAIDVRWIDAERYLFTTITEQGRSIRLGEIGGSSTVVVTVSGRSLGYDFSR